MSARSGRAKCRSLETIHGTHAVTPATSSATATYMSMLALAGMVALARIARTPAIAQRNSGSGGGGGNTERMAGYGDSDAASQAGPTAASTLVSVPTTIAAAISHGSGYWRKTEEAAVRTGRSSSPM